MFKKIILMSLLALTSLPAEASATTAIPLISNDLAASILNCFHPEGAIFVSETGKKRACSNNPCVADEGTIDFKGIITKNPYWMEYEVQKKTDDDGTSYMRIIPTSDNAPVPPSNTCAWRRWRAV